MLCDRDYDFMQNVVLPLAAASEDGVKEKEEERGEGGGGGGEDTSVQQILMPPGADFLSSFYEAAQVGLRVGRRL